MLRLMAWTIALTLSCVIAPGPAQADHNFRQGSPPRGAFVPHHGPVFFNDGFHNRVFFNDRFHNRVFFHNGFHNRVFFHDPFFFHRHVFFRSFVFFGTPVFAPVPVALFPSPAFPAYFMAPVPGAPNCYQYETTIFVDGQPQPAVGTACLGPDGIWRVVP
jgi:hypothetical protein